MYSKGLDLAPQCKAQHGRGESTAACDAYHRAERHHLQAAVASRLLRPIPIAVKNQIERKSSHASEYELCAYLWGKVVAATKSENEPSHPETKYCIALLRAWGHSVAAQVWRLVSTPLTMPTWHSSSAVAKAGLVLYLMIVMIRGHDGLCYTYISESLYT